MNPGAHAIAALSGEPGIASVPAPRASPPDCSRVAVSRLVTGLSRASCRDASGHASCPASPGKRGSVPSPRPLAGTARPGTAQVFRFAADLAWRQGAEVQVLEGNLRRVIGAEASGGKLRARSRQAMRWYARYWLEAFRLPVDRLVGVPVGQRGTRHSPVSRSRRSRSGPRSSRSCLMPGIIRCPESTAIQAGNPDHRSRGEEPGVSACSAGPGVRIPGRRGQRSHSVVVVPLSVPSARLEPRLWWLRTDACRRVGIRCAGRRPAV